MARLKDQSWNLPEGKLQPDGSRAHEYDSIHAALLMDIRDEMERNNDYLMRLVSVLECRNALAIPGVLRKIDKRLAKKIPLR